MIHRRSILLGAPGAFAAIGATRAQSATDDAEVVIGVINDMSGPYSDLGGPGSVLAAQMAVEDFGPDQLGRKLRIVSADHKNKPDLATSLVGDWIERGGVTAIADGGASGAGLAIQAVTRRTQRIFLATGPATSDLTGEQCSPYGFHWTYDSYALASGTARALTAQGEDSWFFITADYAFGFATERDTTKLVLAAGGRVLGGVKVPIGTPDFSSYLLQAQASGAKVIALVLGGADLVNGVKQAVEFGLARDHKLAGLLTFITDVHAMGLPVAKGLIVTTAYDWEIDEPMHAFGTRFMSRFGGRAPSMVQAGTYSGVLHYLKAVKAAGTVAADPVAAQMRALPVNDFMSHDVHIREDGRVMREMYVMQVKTPEASHLPWDYFELIARVPPDIAFRPLQDGHCKLIGKS